MQSVFGFLASQAGRFARIAAGTVLILIGLLVFDGSTVGTIITVIGLVPVAAGAFDVCVFAPLFGMPFRGPRLRKQVSEGPARDDLESDELDSE